MEATFLGGVYHEAVVERGVFLRQKLESSQGLFTIVQMFWNCTNFAHIGRKQHTGRISIIRQTDFAVHLLLRS